MNDGFDEFAKKEKRCEHIGKIIVLTISIFNLVVTALNSFMDFRPVTTALNIVLTVLFMRGFDWIRVLFASILAWNSIWLTFAFFCNITSMPWWLIVLYIIMIAYDITASALLFVSRSVKEYLYVKKNG